MIALPVVAGLAVPLAACALAGKPSGVSAFLREAYTSIRNAVLWRLFVFQLFRLWKLPDLSGEQSQGRRHLLILGSSVAKGEGGEVGPEPNLGWTQRLEAALERRAPERWKTINAAVQFTQSQLWHELITTKTTPEDLRFYSVVILSLSLNNELFTFFVEEEKLREIAQHFLSGVRKIVVELRKRMATGARLALSSPYANDDYTPLHLTILEEVRAEMATWNEVDHYIDFLQESARNPKGHWPEGASRDAAHPNSLGHEGMFQCLDLPTLFGEHW
mmetsp:Transcript_18774/g.35234  ORF Transcript_18774/g.35234 Transcript_18774/m.35234 type:complete len:275 (-) Transcript_18774:33-857(-)